MNSFFFQSQNFLIKEHENKISIVFFFLQKFAVETILPTLQSQIRIPCEKLMETLSFYLCNTSDK